MRPPTKTDNALLDAFREMRTKTEAELLHLQRQRNGLEKAINIAAARLEQCDEMLALAKKASSTKS